MGDSDLPEAMKLLAAEAKKGDAAQQAKVREIIDRARHEASRRTRERILRRRHASPSTLGLLGIIGRWWVVGPFDLGEKNEGWQTEYIGEPNVSVVARYMAGKTAQAVEARRVP